MERIIIPVGIIVTACIDMGTWTNVGATLKITTAYEDDWFDAGADGGNISGNFKDIVDNTNFVSQKLFPAIKDAKEFVEWDTGKSQSDICFWEKDFQLVGGDDDEEEEEQATNLGAFEKAYKGIVEGVDDAWVTLLAIKADCTAITLFHIVCIKLEAGFTLGFCGAIQIGMEYNYDYVRRYSARFDVFDFDVTFNTTDIQKPHSTFLLYAIGAFGLRPAVYISLEIGILDTDLDSVGIVAEASVPILIYLYGILTYDDWKDPKVQFQGGIYVTMAFTINVSLTAQLGHGLLSTSLTVYETSFPLASLGSRYQIRGFAEETNKVERKMFDSMEVTRTLDNVFDFSGTYLDINPSDRQIFALDMQSGDVVLHIPEADEFEYEDITDQVVKADAEFRPGATKEFVMFGTKTSKTAVNLLDDGGHDNDSVNTYERIYLDTEVTDRLAKFEVVIKMTYKPPTGVTVAGRQYVKIIHFKVDQSYNGHRIIYEDLPRSPQNGPTGIKQRAAYLDTETYPLVFPLMPETPITADMLPEALGGIHPEPEHFAGYTYHGFVAERGHWAYETDGQGGYNYRYYTRTTEDPYSAIETRGGVQYLNEDLHLYPAVVPKQQTIRVEHRMKLNELEYYYDDYGRRQSRYKEVLISSRDITNSEIVSDTLYTIDEMEKWGFFEPFTEDETSYLINDGTPDTVLQIFNSNRYRDDEDYAYAEKYYRGYYVTASDDEISETVTIYYEPQRYQIIYEAEYPDQSIVDATRHIDTMQACSSFGLWDGSQVWYQVLGLLFDKLTDTSEVPSDMIMPTHDIHVKFGFKSDTGRTPVYVTFVCDRDGSVLCSGEVFADFGLIPYEDLLTAEGRTYIDTYGGRVPKAWYPADYLGGREIAECDADKTISTPYVRSDYVMPRITVHVTESEDRPEGLKYHLILKENGRYPLVEGETQVFAEMDIAPDNVSCGPMPVPVEGFLDQFKTIPAATAHTDGLTLPAFSTDQLTAHTDKVTVWDDPRYPSYYPSLERSYDADTNTLTYTIYPWVTLETVNYLVRYHYINKDSTEDIEETSYFAEAYSWLNTKESECFRAPAGYDTDWTRTPESFKVQPDGTTEIDYYLVEKDYDVQFVLKNPKTGEVVRETDVYTVPANTEFTTPEGFPLYGQEISTFPGYQHDAWSNGKIWEPAYLIHDTLTFNVDQDTAGVYESVYSTYYVELELHPGENGSLGTRYRNLPYKSVKFYIEKDEDGKYSGPEYTVLTIKTNKEFELPAASGFDGAVFTGWYDNPECTGTPIQPGTFYLTENTTLYAGYIPAFTIHFDGNTGEDEPVEDIDTLHSYLSKVQFPDQDTGIKRTDFQTVRPDYVFVGWSKTADGAELVDTASEIATGETTYYAVWAPRNYEFTFRLWMNPTEMGGAWLDGSETDLTVDHYYGKDTTCAPEDDPVRPGYQFAGWYYKGEVYSAEEFSIGPNDLKYPGSVASAVWEPVTYNITYEPNGGTMPSEYPTTWTYSQQTIIDVKPTVADDAVFKGWYENENLTGRCNKIAEDHTPGDVKLYARWEYPAYAIRSGKFSEDGKQLYDGSLSYTLPETYTSQAETLTLPTPASSDVWAFDHWELIEDGTATMVTEVDLAEHLGGVMLHAVFKKVIYTLTFDANGGTDTGTYPTSVSYGEYAEVPAPTMEGYTFRGWIDEDLGKSFGTSFWMTEKQALNLKAVWRNAQGYDPDAEYNYSVYCCILGGEETTMTLVAENETGWVSTAPVLTVGGIINSYLPEFKEYPNNRRYIFDHVSVDGDTNEYNAIADIPMSADEEYVIRVYYRYRDYEVNYRTNDYANSAILESRTLHYDDVIPAPLSEPTRQDYKFQGWDFDFTKGLTVGEVMDGDGENVDIGVESVDIITNTWLYDIHTINYVNWWPEDDTAIPYPTSFTSSTARNFVVCAPGRPGYTAEDVYVVIEGVDSDVDVEFDWVKVEYTISYKLDNGEVMEDDEPLTTFTVDTNAGSYLLPTLFRDGYTFEGWELYGYDMEVTKLPVKDLYRSYIVTPVWSLNDYTLTVDLNGGTIDVPATVNETTTYTIEDVAHHGPLQLPYLEKDGFSFKGWDMYIKETGEHKTIGNVGSFTYPQTCSDIVMTAKFELLPGTVSFDLNDADDPRHPASNSNGEYYYPGSTGTVSLNEPTRIGYTFVGWTSDVDFGNIKAGELFEIAILDTTVKAPELELTAHWKPNPCSITYKLNGGSLDITSPQIVKDAYGVYMPEGGTLTNPRTYSTLNTIELEDPTHTVAFLGWSSEQLFDLQIFTGVDLGGASRKLYTTAEVELLLNSPAKALGFEEYLWDTKETGIILTAVWADETYALSYLLAGGEMPEGLSNPESYRNSDETITLNNPVRDGYTFVGWERLGSDDPISDSMTIETGSYGSRSYQAVWERNVYAITYVLGDGEDAENEAMHQFTAEDPTIYFGIPTLKNAVFNGWTITDTETGEVLEEKYPYRAIDMFMGDGEQYLRDLTVTANWLSLYAAIWADPNGGEYGSTEGYWTFYPDQGGKILCEDPVRPGYICVGWTIEESYATCTDAEEPGYHYIEIEPNAADSSGIHMTAIWAPRTDIEYTVKFYLREEDVVFGGTEDTLVGQKTYQGTMDEVLDIGFLAMDAPNRVANGELTAVWNGDTSVNPNGTVKLGADGLTLEMYFEFKMYNVFFKTDSDNHIINIEYCSGDPIEDPHADEWNAFLFDWPGYTFGGWFEDKQCNIPFDIENAVMGSEDLYLYAKRVPTKYTITYQNWPEGVENTNPQFYTIEDTSFYVVYPAMNPNATGYDCGGLTDEELATYTQVSLNKDTGDKTVKTPWQLHRFTITYPEAGSYSGTKTETYDMTESVTLPTPSMTGRTFEKWTAVANGNAVELEGSLETGFVIPAGTKGDITLTAVYDASHTITYEGLEGSSFAETNPNPATYSMEDATFTIQNPTKIGYTFSGWYVNGADYTTQTVELPVSYMATDISLKAAWTAVPYEIEIYELDEQDETYYGASWYDIENTRSESGVVLTAPNRDGYRFEGWTVYVKDESGLLTGETVTLDEGDKLPAGTIGNLKAVASYSEIIVEEPVYEITYALGEGGAFAEDAVVITSYKDSEVNMEYPILVPEPARKGYYFNGWTLTDTNGWSEDFYYGEISMGYSSDLTLTANWELEYYYISYYGLEDLEDLSSYTSEYTIWDDDIVLPAPAQAGFLGWTVTDFDGNTIELVDGNIIPAATCSHLSVTANWSSGSSLQITAQPEDVTVTVGKACTFTVTAEGEGLTYQWQVSTDGGATFNDTTTAGYTTMQLRPAATAARNGYQYRCVITDANGKQIISDPATLTVQKKLAITKQPADVTAAVGEACAFTVNAEGEGLKYQWQVSTNGGATFNDTTTAGYTTMQLRPAATAARNGYQYRCVITDANGKQIISDPATLTVKKDLAITKQPANVTAEMGSTCVFTVNAEGEGLKYQWQVSTDGGATFNDTTIAGYTTMQLRPAATAARNGYQYRCVITDADNNQVISEAATLTITFDGLTLTRQPVDVTVAAGSACAFTVAAVGEGLKYQWQVSTNGGAKFNNTTTAGYTTVQLRPTATAARNGYQYRCVITDADNNQVISNAATLTVK